MPSIVVNHKRTERIYREEGLSLRKRKRKKTAAVAQIALLEPQGANEMWSMDFVTDSIVTGRRFRALAIVDQYFRECPAIDINTSLGGARVVAVLDRLAETRELPRTITIDNGPEFAGRGSTNGLITRASSSTSSVPASPSRTPTPRASWAG